MLKKIGNTAYLTKYISNIKKKNLYKLWNMIKV